MTKRRKILLIITAVILAMCIFVSAFFAYIGIKGYGLSLGRFYSDIDGTYIITDSQKAKLSDKSKKNNLFSSLSNGDLILAVNDGIKESYPPQTSAYAVFKIKNGSDEDIDENVKEEQTDLTDTNEVSLSSNFASISLNVLENWTAETDKKDIDSENSQMSISIFPKGHDEGKIKIVFYGEMIGYCGTGLESKEIKLSNYDARQNTYYDDYPWSFIDFPGLAGTYVIYAEDADKWWDSYGDEAMEILGTIKISDGNICEDEAVKLASEICSTKYDHRYAYFDFKEGIWNIKYSVNSEVQEIITVSYDGKKASSDINPQNSKKIFLANVLEIKNKSQIAIVEPFESEEEYKSADKISFSYKDLANETINEGDIVKIKYNGEIKETYPAEINALSWEKATDLREIEYSKEWLKTKEETQGDYFSDIVITEIYSNCFFAEKAYPLPYTMKINGSLPDSICVGDQISAVCKNAYLDEENKRVEGDLVSLEESDFVLNPNACYKPVIYLYPTKETDIEVKLDLNGTLTCTYPEYNNYWKVTASPDGTLKDENNQTYNYLYWEGEVENTWDFSKGFCVKGQDTAKFLEHSLEKLGLNRKEANEFIVYWLPIMQENEYNIISFQNSSYTDATKLNITPTPDTVIRVFMAFKKSDSYVDMSKQELTSPERNGFTVVEWGGTEVK